MLLDYAKVSLLMMRAKPVRSALSISGIFIGVLALVIILSIHEGAREQVDDMYRVEGTRIFIVMPSFDEASMKMGTLTLDDAQRLKSIPEIQSTLPRLTAEKSVRAGHQAGNVQLMGIDDVFIPTYRIPLLQGRNFLPTEIKDRHPVCMLTDKGARKLFPWGKALGRSIDIQGDPLQVIGIARWSSIISQRSFVGGEPEVLVPAGWLARGREATMLSMLEIRVDPRTPAPLAGDAIRRLLSHGDARRAKLYTIESLEEYVQSSRESIDRMLRALLAIAAVSLVVGGIGVANVMLTSVTERTKEVGIRKALGARRHDILAQFLIESSILTATGGLLAVFCGSLGIAVLPVFVPISIPIMIPKLAIVSCLVLTVSIGLIAGAYPASRAAALSPAEALRYE